MKSIFPHEPCERCHGEGVIEKNIPGNEGEPEQDVEIECPDCGGSGKQIDADDEYNYVTDEMLAEHEKTKQKI